MEEEIPDPDGSIGAIVVLRTPVWKWYEVSIDGTDDHLMPRPSLRTFYLWPLFFWRVTQAKARAEHHLRCLRLRDPQP